jgi:hypothetical protein
MLQAGRSGGRYPFTAMIVSIDLIFPASIGPGVYSVFKRNEYQKQEKKNFLGSTAWQARKADNLTAICEPIVYTM